MTAKQARILEAATALFAREGYDATSTARVAREAEVSEGLIFRHFGSKRGLLDAIAAVADARDRELRERLAAEFDPTARIGALIDAAFRSARADGPYRALRAQFAATGQAFGESSGKLTETLLRKAFAELQYEDPAAEAKFLRHALEGISAARATGELRGAKELKTFVRHMYG